MYHMADGSSASRSLVGCAASVAGAEVALVGELGEGELLSAGATTAGVAAVPVATSGITFDSVPRAVASNSGDWLSSGTTTLVPHLGHTARLPAKNDFTFSLWPSGHKNLMPIKRANPIK
jgi:hypothetical protein